MTETLEQPKTEKIKSMFGKVDRKHLFDRETEEYKGEHISSSYPAYMHPKSMQDLEQGINETSESIAQGHVYSSALEYTKRRLKKERIRLDDIKDQIPKYSSVELKAISSSRKDLDTEIKAALFTKSDMETRPQLGAEEARRMTEPCIKVDKLLAAQCNVSLTNGKCTRSEAEKIRKMALWHETNGEATGFTDELRDDRGSHMGKSNLVSVDGSLEDMEVQRVAREKAIDERLSEIDKGESKLEDIGFIQSLKDFMIKDELIPVAEVDRMLAAYPEVALSGVNHRNLHATLAALKTVDNQEQVEIANSPIKESLIEPMWTCPDCDKEMKPGAKSIHTSRYCPNKKEK